MSLIKIIRTLFKRGSFAVDVLNMDDAQLDKLKKSLDDDGVFTYNAFGFEILLEDGLLRINWKDIERLQAYKTDLGTVDELCMNIIVDNRVILITEETRGLHRFIDKIKLELPIMKENWEESVLQPPFQYNLTTIYERVDRVMPLEPNFYSTINGKTKDYVVSFFQDKGWLARKVSFTDIELQNSWTELTLSEDSDCLLLHGLIAYHKDNVRVLRTLFEALDCTYKFEFYKDKKIVDHVQNGM